MLTEEMKTCIERLMDTLREQCDIPSHIKLLAIDTHVPIDVLLKYLREELEQ